MVPNPDGRPASDPFVHDPFYEMGDLGYLVDSDDEESTPLAGTHFYSLEGSDGILLDGRAALYGHGDLGVTTSRAATFSSELQGYAYEWDLDDVRGERWAARQDPWDGP